MKLSQNLCMLDNCQKEARLRTSNTIGRAGGLPVKDNWFKELTNTRAEVREMSKGISSLADRETSVQELERLRLDI
jgi:hypothetical protein